MRFEFSWFAIRNAGSDDEDFASDEGFVEAESAEQAEAIVMAQFERDWADATIKITIEAVQDSI